MWVAAWRNRDVCYIVSLNHAVSWENSEYGARGISLACAQAPNCVCLCGQVYVGGGLAAVDCDYKAQ